MTRAVESLHIFIPQKGAKGPNVGQLILQNIAPEDGTVRLDGLEGSCSRDEAAETYEFGEFAGPEPDTHRKAKAAHVLLGDYPTSADRTLLRGRGSGRTHPARLRHPDAPGLRKRRDNG